MHSDFQEGMEIRLTLEKSEDKALIAAENFKAALNTKNFMLMWVNANDGSS